MPLWFEWTWWFWARCTASKPSCAQSSCGDLPPPQPPLNLGLSKTGVTINRVLHGHCSFSLWAIYFWPHQSSSEKNQNNGMAPAWAEDGTELVELQPREAKHQGRTVGTELLLQQYTEQSTAPAEPGLTRKKSAIQVLTNKYSCCTCLTSLTEIWNGSDREVYHFNNSRKHWFIEFWFYCKFYCSV